MKILILQLARLGDIYSTWPSIRAIKRTNPNAEVHIVVRPRFAKALEGLSALDKIHILPMTDIFTSLLGNELSDEDSFEGGMKCVNNFLGVLADESYTHIYNLSFSPVSSFLTKLIEKEGVSVRGYTRQSDGFLRIPDDTSAYFYAQMGVDGSNRFHVNDVFSEICGVELTDEDYLQPVQHELPSLVTKMLGESKYIIFHVGASQSTKSLSSLKVINLVKRLISSRVEKIVLIGSPEEEGFATKVVEAVRGDQLISFVGKTQLIDLFPLIRNANLVIGADSAPIHIASLVATPVYNLSNKFVRFWETGPRSAGSRIRVVEDFDYLGTDLMHDDIEAIIEDKVATDELIVVEGLTKQYQVGVEDKVDKFKWNLVEAIYLGKDFPVPRTLDFVEAVRQLQELNGLCLQQFHAILKKENHVENMNILENVDDLIERLVQMVPDVEPIVKWYQTEKLRVEPAEKSVIVGAYTEIHTTLAKVLSIYLGDEIDSIEEELSHGNELTK